MALDPITLGTAFVLLSGVLGALLLFAWMLNREVRALAFWGTSFCLSAVGIGLANLGHGAPDFTILLVANALMALAYGVLYAGCRTFCGRSGLFLWSIVGMALWVMVFPVIHDSLALRVSVMSLIAGSYAALSAWELWRHSSRRLASLYAAVVLLLSLAVFNGFRAMLGLSPSAVPILAAFASRWSAQMGLFLVVFGPTLAFVFLSMAKEYVEADFKRAALIDSLTGIPNRRAFMQNAAALLTRLGERPASCLLFDLDNFKAVNDRYGHDAGDQILSAFGQVLKRHLPDRSFGRLGGEEFGAIVPLAAEEATALAEAIRRAFAAMGEAVLGSGTNVTVSVGCATERRAKAEDLLRKADRALYRAKAEGRNIVVAA